MDINLVLLKKRAKISARCCKREKLLSRMEAKYCNEPPRSSEEEDELGRSVKKFKENGGGKQDTPLRKNISYKDSLIGDIPRAY